MYHYTQQSAHFGIPSTPAHPLTRAHLFTCSIPLMSRHIPLMSRVYALMSSVASLFIVERVMDSVNNQLTFG